MATRDYPEGLDASYILYAITQSILEIILNVGMRLVLCVHNTTHCDLEIISDSIDRSLTGLTVTRRTGIFG